MYSLGNRWMNLQQLHGNESERIFRNAAGMVVRAECYYLPHNVVVCFCVDYLMCVEQDRLGQAFEDAFDILRQHSAGSLQYSPDYKNCLSVMNHYPHVRANSSCYGMLPTEEPVYNWRTLMNSAADCCLEGNIHPSLQNPNENHLVQAAVLQQKGGKGRKKLRLFEYLYESLCNPEMASCIQWIDRSKGIFQFISKNKELLAELWGKRKGNRKTMTYQKMARALRNYGRTGEIMKIRRKLTYQFSEALLQRFSSSFLKKEILYSPYFQGSHDHHSLNNWNASYNHTFANYHEIDSS
ncbi:PREDICTED: transcription factor Spi-C [Elephantulus edwardii]|uniref:transcription factor Spi-C n=1 Tax=Elephantulus edwardii TaxID=28737 RepID=UPI0003F0CE86|nr:PREDICTED: transcription factor Spi-C [Elephantulus edwardii]